jgi:hypothetical protein
LGQLSSEFPEIAETLVEHLKEADLRMPSKPTAASLNQKSTPIQRTAITSDTRRASRQKALGESTREQPLRPQSFDMGLL